MKINLGKAISSPTLDPQGPVKVAIGVALGFLCFLIFPMLITGGYCLEVARQSAQDEDTTTLPTWDRWGDYLARGWWGFVIALVFFAVPAMLSFVGASSNFVHVIGAGPAIIAQQGSPDSAMGMGPLCVTAAKVLYLFISFFVPMAMLRYALSLKLGDAFNVSEIISDIKRSPAEYLVCWAVPGAIFTCGSMLLQLLPIPIFLATFLSLSLGFYVGLVNANLMGQYYRANLLSQESQDEQD